MWKTGLMLSFDTFAYTLEYECPEGHSLHTCCTCVVCVREMVIITLHMWGNFPQVNRQGIPGEMWATSRSRSIRRIPLYDLPPPPLLPLAWGPVRTTPTVMCFVMQVSKSDWPINWHPQQRNWVGWCWGGGEAFQGEWKLWQLCLPVFVIYILFEYPKAGGSQSPPLPGKARDVRVKCQ